MAIRHEIESRYEYPAGIALSKFLEGLREGKIVSGRCARCGWAVVPPRAFCVKCFSPEMKYVEIQGDWHVEIFTKSSLQVDGRRARKGIIWIFARSEGVEGGLLHRLGGSVKPVPGMKVRPVFRKERIGSILDIECFAPPKRG